MQNKNAKSRGRTLKITAEIIKEKAIALFLTQGYYSSSMNHIADACKVKKSSLYHHIESRDALLLSIFDDIKTDFIERMNNAPQNSDPLKHFVQTSKAFYKKEAYGYLLLKLCCEIGDNNPTFKQSANAFYRDWVKQLGKLLPSNNQKTNAKQAAELLLIQINGALHMDAIQGNNNMINRVWRLFDLDN